MKIEFDNEEEYEEFLKWVNAPTNHDDPAIKRVQELLKRTKEENEQNKK